MNFPFSSLAGPGLLTSRKAHFSPWGKTESRCSASDPNIGRDRRHSPCRRWGSITSRGRDSTEHAQEDPSIKCVWVGRELCPLRLHFLRLFEGAGYFAKGESVSIIDSGRLVGFQALVVEARGIGAVQVGHCIGTSNMLDRGVNT